MEEKPKIVYPVVVEGKYDKIKLTSIFEATVLTTDGFSVFNDDEKAACFRRLAKRTKIILFTDSDSAGNLIRRFFRGSVPKDALIELYSPQIKGREKRKKAPSAEGFLGVEGMDKETLLSIFAPYLAGADAPAKTSPLRRNELYLAGLDGGENSREKRKILCRLLSLPENLSTGALLDALNLLYDGDEIRELIKKTFR